MGQGTGVLVCPKGHNSSEADYCSECGARIQGSGPTEDGQQSHASGGVPGDVCPDCGTMREHGAAMFCEVCGYNFVTGAHGEVPVADPAERAPEATATPAPEPPPASPAALQQQWTVTVSIDPVLRGPESPEPPSGFAPFDIALTQPVNLIGRRNESRGIFPEIALDHDEAVSRRHALLQVDPEHGLLLRDIGAANGTRLNGKELPPMTDHPVSGGDEITLGHWTRLRVTASHT